MTVLWLVVAPDASDLVETTVHVTAYHAWRLAKVRAAFNECQYRRTRSEHALSDLRDLLNEINPERVALTPWLVNEELGGL
jgi:hypothetical protein